MKNIFKKNQVIITALAIMIVIAGYLSFANNGKPEDQDNIEATNPDYAEYEDIMATEGTDVAQNTTDGTNADDLKDGTEIAADNAKDGTQNIGTTAADDDNDETTPVKTSGNNELGETSGKDILDASANVTDTGELDLEEGVPGEAVLASATLDAGFFFAKQLEREQMRARNKEVFLEIIKNPDIKDELKKDTINRMLELTEIAEKENNAEIMLQARGFDDALVSIIDGKVDVVINATNLTEQQTAIIEEVVKNKTEIPVGKMTIVPVVISE